MVVWTVEVAVTSMVETPSSAWLAVEAEAEAVAEGALTTAELELEVERADDEPVAAADELGVGGEREELVAEQARLTSRRLANVPRRSTDMGTTEWSRARGRRGSPGEARWARERENAL